MLVASISAVVKSFSMVEVTCSTHDSQAVSPKTRTSGRLIATRICKVERKMVAQLSRTASQPISKSHPGCRHRTQSSCHQTSSIRARSRDPRGLVECVVDGKDRQFVD